MTITNTSTVSHAFAVRDRTGSLHGEACVLDFLRCLMGESAASFDSPTQWRRARLVSIYFLIRCSYICSCQCLTCNYALVHVWHIGIRSGTIVVHDDGSSYWVWFCSLLPMSACQIWVLNPYVHVNRFGSLARILFEGLTSVSTTQRHNTMQLITICIFDTMRIAFITLWSHYDYIILVLLLMNALIVDFLLF